MIAVLDDDALTGVQAARAMCDFVSGRQASAGASGPPRVRVFGIECPAIAPDLYNPFDEGHLTDEVVIVPLASDKGLAFLLRVAPLSIEVMAVWEANIWTSPFGRSLHVAHRLAIGTTIPRPSRADALATTLRRLVADVVNPTLSDPLLVDPNAFVSRPKCLVSSRLDCESFERYLGEALSHFATNANAHLVLQTATPVRATRIVRGHDVTDEGRALVLRLCDAHGLSGHDVRARIPSNMRVSLRACNWVSCARDVHIRITRSSALRSAQALATLESTSISCRQEARS